MKMRVAVAVAILTVIGLVIVGSWSVHAQAARGTRWEYCSLNADNATPHPVARGTNLTLPIRYSTVQGVRTEAVEGEDKGEVFHRAVAKLGTEGWEMVAFSDRTAYFKRPRP